jgi:hypothetical protein
VSGATAASAVARTVAPAAAPSVVAVAPAASTDDAVDPDEELMDAIVGGV